MVFPPHSKPTAYVAGRLGPWVAMVAADVGCGVDVDVPSFVEAEGRPTWRSSQEGSLRVWRRTSGANQRSIEPVSRPSPTPITSKRTSNRIGDPQLRGRREGRLLDKRLETGWS